jgi:hypothetical protein
MAVTIDWSLLRPVDFAGELQQGIEMGRSLAQRAAVEGALRDLTPEMTGVIEENPSANTPEVMARRRKAEGVLAMYAPDRFAALERVRYQRQKTAEEIAEKQRRAAIFGQYGTDPAGARQAALGGADLEALKVIEGLDESRREMLAAGARLLEQTNPTDDASWQQTLQLAGQAGIDISGAPPTFDPQYVEGVKQLGRALNTTKPAALPADVQEYEYARGQGYQGTYEAWRKENGSPFVVDRGNGQKTIYPSAQAFFDEQNGGATSPSSASPAPPSAPASSGGGAYDPNAAAQLGSRFGTVTSQARTPDKNRAVDGVPNSHHLTTRGGRAIDIARKPGVSHREIEQAYRAAGFNVIESLDEGDHSHLAFAGGPAGGTTKPHKVASKAEFDKLPSGAHFIAPDGSVRMKP